MANQMSKIIRQMYAEARAAREAAANPNERINDTQITGPDPIALARSAIEWWTTQMEKTGERFKQAPHQQGAATTR